MQSEASRSSKLAQRPDWQPKFVEHWEELGLGCRMAGFALVWRMEGGLGAADARERRSRRIGVQDIVDVECVVGDGRVEPDGEKDW